VYLGQFTKKWDTSIRRKAQIKLDILDAAMSIEDLRVPPSNRLHQLKGNRKEYLSISINKQWRIIFKWDRSNATEVEIIDYH
ncbi:MAG: type II toxin-antitoxin system RelE/ParE family toxin, partial [Bacteroidota bacterium]